MGLKHKNDTETVPRFYINLVIIAKIHFEMFECKMLILTEYATKGTMVLARRQQMAVRPRQVALQNNMQIILSRKEYMDTDILKLTFISNYTFSTMAQI